MANLKLNGVIDPLSDTIIIGTETIVGLAEDDAVTLERDENVSSTMNGMDDSYSIATIRNSRGTLTIRLQETSPSNEVFWTLLAGYNAIGVVPVNWSIKRNATFPSSEPIAVGGGLCWVESQTPITLGREVTEREWVLKVDDANLNLAAASSTAANV